MKTYLALALSFAATSAFANPEWGPADTVACYNVGPGIEYTKIIYPDKPLIIWYSTIDLTNPYNKVEQVMSRHQVPDVNRWDVMTHYKENSRPGHQVKIAWNHDFFVYESGICIGGNISDGQITHLLTGRSMLAITADKKAEIFLPGYDTKIITADNTEVGIDIFNASAAGLTGDCIFFNHLNGTTLSEPGTYIQVQPQQPWIVNGDDIPCKILAISNEPLQTSPTECVIYLRGSKLNALDGHVKVGDVLSVRQRVTSPSWGIAPEDILNGFHGYPSIAHDGVLHEGEYNNFENGREYEKSSHVMAGISKDKTKLYICLNEMSTQSQPIDCVEMANWMLQRGAWDIVNFDSGGSAAIVINEEMQNLPGRGSVRPVQNAMLAVSLAPEDNTVTQMSFSKKVITTATISSLPLSVVSYNQYGDIVEENVAGCTYTVSPENLGYVDSNGIFHSNQQGGSGKIIATKGNVSCEVPLNVQEATDVQLPFSELLIDSSRQYIIPVYGIVNGKSIPLEAEAFQWEPSTPGIVKIEEGVLSGIQNGTTTVTGTFGNLSISFDVTVEIGKGSMSVLNFKEIIDQPSTSTSGLTNLTVTDNIPSSWKNGTGFHVDKIGGRLLRINHTGATTIYGLPDDLSMNVYDPQSAIDRVLIQLTDKQSNVHNIEVTPSGTDCECVFNLSKDDIPFDIQQFPIKITNLSVYFKATTNADFALGDLMANYPIPDESSVTAISTPKALTISNNTETLNVSFASENETKAQLLVYNTSGTLVQNSSIQVEQGNNSFAMDISFLPTGIYFVTLLQEGKQSSEKFIIR